MTGAQLDLLDRYAELLVSYNEKVNLTAITSPEGIEDRHFADSLLFAAQPGWWGKNNKKVTLTPLRMPKALRTVISSTACCWPRARRCAGVWWMLARAQGFPALWRSCFARSWI